jgi:hypothetical protein
MEHLQRSWNRANDVLFTRPPSGNGAEGLRYEEEMSPTRVGRVIEGTFFERDGIGILVPEPHFEDGFMER